MAVTEHPSRSVRRNLQPTTPIRALDLSIRSYNRLRKAEISTVHDIACSTPRGLLAVDGFGRKCLSEIADVLEEFFSFLGPAELAQYAAQVRNWRLHFSHPERVPAIIHPLRPPDLQPTNADTHTEAGAEYRAALDPSSLPQSKILVEDLPISTRARNILFHMHVRNLHQLAATPPPNPGSLPNCGRTTIMELADVVSGYLSSIPPEGEMAYGSSALEWRRRALAPRDERAPRRILPLLNSPAHSLTQAVEHFLEALDERQRNILLKRSGIATGERKTLEAIGREFGLTRERVRQIVERCLKSLARIIRTTRPDIYPYLSESLRAVQVASLDELATGLKNAGGSETLSVKACLRMLLLAGSEGPQPLDPAGQLWSASKQIARKDYLRVLETANNALRGIPRRSDQVALEVAKSLKKFGDEDLRLIRTILRYPSAGLRAEASPDGEVLHPSFQNPHDQRRSFMYDYIKEQGVPVPIKEILSAMQDSRPELIPDSPSPLAATRSLASSLDRDDRFAWAGLSTWGLREWGYPSGVTSIGGAAIELLRSAARPLSSAEITESLSQIYRLSPASVHVALRSVEGTKVRRDTSGRWLML